jgi:hypothetical protein
LEQVLDMTDTTLKDEGKMHERERVPKCYKILSE